MGLVVEERYICDKCGKTIQDTRAIKFKIGRSRFFNMLGQCTHTQYGEFEKDLYFCDDCAMQLSMWIYNKNARVQEGSDDE